MEFPQTPKTVLEKLIAPEQNAAWNGAWRDFFDIYHATIKVMVCNSFYRRGLYGVPASVTDDVIADVVISLNEIFAARRYDAEKSRFRFFLKTVCDRRVVDFLRKNGGAPAESLDDDACDARSRAESEAAENGTSETERLEAEELRAFRRAILLDAYTCIRGEFAPYTCVAFEMVKLEGLPVERVVSELGVSPNVVNNAVHRITKRLREALSRDENFKELTA